ncbi:MAG: sensor histidine kinase [Caulobacterales bacterium]
MARARPPRHPSLVGRLVLIAAVWSLAVLFAAGLGLTALFRQEATDFFDESLSTTVDNLLAGTSVDDSGQIDAPALTDQRALRVFSGKYWEIATPGPNGTLKSIVRSRSLWDTGEILPPPGGAGVLAKTPGQTIFYDSIGPEKEALRVAALQSRFSGVAYPVIFLVGEDRAPIDADIRTFETTTGGVLVLLGIGLIAAVIVQVRFGLQPLFNLRREVAAVRTGKADRVQGAYPIELEPLASELNALVAHNQDVVERQRTHVGNLAHALKTPLSVMLTEAERRPGALAKVVERQADLMRQQVDHHLRRARAAARQGGGERAEVEPVLDELARTLERIFRDKGVEIDWSCDEALSFSGERQDLLEIAGNVMENACKWCKGRVRVAATSLSPAQWRLVVEDDGPGLASADRDEVLRRGARLDESAPGSGLGLSIVDELARAYGGALTLGDSPLGGLQVEALLPRAER